MCVKRPNDANMVVHDTVSDQMGSVKVNSHRGRDLLALLAGQRMLKQHVERFSQSAKMGRSLLWRPRFSGMAPNIVNILLGGRG